MATSTAQSITAGASGNGSGVILSADGYVLTNNHVATLEGATSDPSIRVTLSDGRIFDAELVGSDPIADLAVVKLDDADGLPVIEFADSDALNVGDQTPANRTVAGVVAGDDGYADLRWFPAHAPRAFGHHGAGGQLCWVDPDTGMSFCFLHDTLEQHPGAELTRIRDLNELAHACVRP